MRSSFRSGRAAVWLAIAAVIAGCPIERDNDEGEEQQPQQSRLRFEVVRSERQLYVYRDDVLIRTHDVAVGQPEWPTPTGQWSIHQVDWNPDWTPPEGEWAAGAEYTPPGHPDNPMGRARLLFNPPYTIHGTEDLESLGTNQSHGSIRVANEVGIELGRLLMDEGGVERDDEWYQEVLDTPTEMREVPLELPTPIIVRD